MKPVACFVVGTRPEAIKVAPVILAARRDGRLDPVLVASGQHVEPVTQALRAFDVVPDHTFDLPRSTGSLAELTALLVPTLDRLFADRDLAVVVVQGDTLTAML